MAFLHDLYLRAEVGKQVESNCVVLVSFATKKLGHVSPLHSAITMHFLLSGAAHCAVEH